MLFESEAKAVNFINFNADDMAAENKGVPVRAYFCAACGGWHITKHDNADWFKAKEVSQNVILTYQSELKIIITDFFTNYSNKQDFEVWKVKMDKALELYDKLQELEVHNEVMVKAGRCFKQFQVNLAREKKKAMAQAAEVYLAPVRVLAEKLEAEILDFNLTLAKETAGEMRDKLEEMKGLRIVSDDIARLQGMTDMVLDTELYTLLEGMMEAIKSAQHKVLVAKTVLTTDEVEDLDAKLLAVNESSAIKKTVIKRFRCNIHAVKNGSAENERKINQARQYEDAQCIKQSRALLGEVVAAMEAGDREKAEDKLDVAYIYLERMSHTKSWFELSAMADKLKEMLS